MNVLPTLRHGDVVDVVAPASATSMQMVEAGCAVLRRWGLVPRLADPLFGASGFYASDDDTRARQLFRGLQAADSRAVWAVRGGYGCSRLLVRLARLPVPRTRKLLIGFSDITVLQSVIGQDWRWPAVHGPNLAQLGRSELPARHVAELRAMLTGSRTSMEHRGLRPLNAAARGLASVSGVLRGGNLKLCQSLLGTPWQPRWRGAVVVLEDVDERAYSVDRMLVQMQQAGLWRGVRGIVFGDFSAGLEPDGRALHADVLAGFEAASRVPVFSGLAFGHGARFRPLPLGLRVSLAGGSRGCLTAHWRATR